MKRVCKASDCTNPAEGRQLFCSPQCRYRTYRQRLYKKRARLGVCLQCGGEMDSPTSPITGTDIFPVDMEK